MLGSEPCTNAAVKRVFKEMGGVILGEFENINSFYGVISDLGVPSLDTLRDSIKWIQLSVIWCSH